MFCVPNNLNKDIPVTLIVKNVTKFRRYVSRAKNKEQIHLIWQNANDEWVGDCICITGTLRLILKEVAEQ